MVRYMKYHWQYSQFLHLNRVSLIANMNGHFIWTCGFRVSIHDASKSAFLEDHLVASQCPRFVREYVLNLQVRN